MATTTPTTPHKNACFAVVNLAGSPCAAKNKMPAKTKRITAMPVKISQTALNILVNKLVIGGPVPNGRSAKAEEDNGKIKAPNKVKNNKLFFI